MKKLLVLSGKGGTGKTTTCASFIKFSNAKAFADCDVDAPNLHLVNKFDEVNCEEKDFYGSNKAFIDNSKCVKCNKCFENCKFDAIKKDENNDFKIVDYLCEGCGVCEYVCKEDAIKLLSDKAGVQKVYKDKSVFSTAKLKMGRGNSGKLVASVKSSMVKNANEDTTLAIIDGSPGIGCPVISSISGTDLVLIVAEPSMSGLSDLKRLVKTAFILQTKIAVCVNKFDVNIQKSKEIEMFCNEKNIDFLGFIPFDKTVSKAINEGKSIADYDCKARNALYDIYKKTISLLNI